MVNDFIKNCTVIITCIILIIYLFLFISQFGAAWTLDKKTGCICLTGLSEIWTPDQETYGELQPLFIFKRKFQARRVMGSDLSNLVNGARKYKSYMMETLDDIEIDIDIF